MIGAADGQGEPSMGYTTTINSPAHHDVISGQNEIEYHNEDDYISF